MQKPVFTVLFVFLVVTVLLLTCAPQAQAAITIDGVVSSNSSGVSVSSFLVTDTVYAHIDYHGNGAGPQVRLYVMSQSPSNGASLTDVSGGYETVTTSSSATTFTVWSPSVTAGTYYIVLDLNMDGIYRSTDNDKISSSFIVSKIATTLAVSCNPLTVDKTGTQTTTISGYLKSCGVGISSKTISLSYSNGASYPIVTCVTNANGFYQFQWDVPVSVANGYYVIIAEFAGDLTYSGSLAQTSGGGNLFVVPEYTFGGLAALAACLGALIIFKKRKTSPA